MEDSAGNIVSDKRQLEYVRSSLRENKRRLSMALNAANAGVWEWNLKTGEEYWDENTEELFGLEPGTFEGTYAAFTKRVHPEDLPAVEEAAQEAIEHRGSFRTEFRIQTDDGEQRWMLSRGEVSMDESGEPEKMIGVTIDITEQKEVKQALRDALEQKEILLEEIHHRVKNNLQVISSMLRLQAGLLPDTAGAKKQLEESQLRIRAMGMIHEHLYNSGVTDQMSIDKYIRELVGEILKIHWHGDPNPDVQYEIDEEMHLEIDQAVSCGLIINEMVTNVLTHAFKEDAEDPRLRITFQSGDEYMLFVEDNGCGLPEQFSTSNTDTLGMKILNSMAEQLDGQLSIDDGEYTRFTVNFPA